MGKILTINDLKKIRTRLKDECKTVVFTNGVFDIIHRGHLEYLLKAKSLGDILIIGLNSDNSVKKIKGDKRPIVNQDDRAFILANITMVDYICLFEEETPKNLINEIIPDILVKGADWSKDDIVGKEIVEKIGGRVETIDFVENRSTTNIVNIIIDRYCKNS